MIKTQIITRRFIASFLVCLTILNLVPVKANALDIYSDLEIKQIVYSNAHKITTPNNSFTDQRGVFKGLKNLLISGIWTDYVFNNKEGLTFSQVEKDTYYSAYKNKVTDFINKYNEKDGNKYLPINLSTPSGSQSTGEYVKLIQESSSYVDSYFNALLAEYNSKDNSGKELFLTDNKSRIVAAYEVLLRLNQESEFLSGLTTKVDNPDVYTIDVSSISTLLNKSEYRIFYDKAISELEKGINAVGKIEVSPGEDPVSKFTAVDPNSKEKQEAVNKAYIAALSVSSVYLPLESYVGDERYITALDFLTNGNKSVSEAYSEFAGYKKPIYLREYSESLFDSSSSKTEGDAKRITLGELIEMVRDGKTGSLITIKGSFVETEDSDTYMMSMKNSVNRIQNGENVGDYEKDEKKEEETEEDSDKVPSNGTDLIEYEGVTQPLEETITNETFFSEPIFNFGKRGLAGINTMLLNNMMSNKNPNVQLNNQSFYNQQLYVNAFGDIVLSNNLVVVPAASNATYYVEGSDVVYNPFTDAFMDSYPSIYKQEEFLVPATDEGKIAINVTEGSKSYLDFLSVIKFRYSVSLEGFLVAGEDKIKSTGFWSDIKFNPIDVGMYDPVAGEKRIIFTPEDKKFSWFKGKFISSGKDIMVVNTNVLSSEGLSVPLYPVSNAKEEDVLLRNKYVVQSFYSSMVTNEDGSEATVANGRLDDKKLYNLMAELFNGRNSVYGYEKGVYNAMALKEESGVFAQIIGFVKDMANNVVNSLGSAPGMIGLRSATQDKLMGTFLYYARVSMPFIMVIIVIAFIIMYSRGNDNFTFMIFKALIVAGLTFLSIYIVPKYLSNITNLPVNNGSNRLAFDSLNLRQEMMIDKSNVTATYSDFGKFGLANSSITLYAFTEDQLDNVCAKYDADYLKVSSGGTFVIDDSSGLFVQGDKLKLSLDRMFNTQSITTHIEDGGSATFYKLERQVHVDTVLDYYTPYSIIVDGFIGQLNKLSDVYQLTRTSLPYPGGIRKDNFFVNSYVNSPIFLSPRDPRETDPDMDVDLYDRIVDKFLTTEIGNEDWLGFHESFKSGIRKDEAKASLWYNTMEQNGFFGLEELSEKKYQNLVFYVNDNTKAFLIRNRDILSYMSDENLIEITSLYATMLFNTAVSEFGNKLYPERINYEELSVIDTIRPVITKDYNKFTAMSRDIVDYVNFEYGWLGLISLSLIVLFQGLTSLFLTYALYIMYLLLLVFSFIKFLTKNETVNDTVKGFTKLYGLLILVYLINVYGLQILNNFESSGLTLLFLVLLSSACMGLTTSVVYFTLSGFGTMDFGNSRINGSIGRLVSKLPLLGSMFGRNGFIGNIFTKSFRTSRREYDPLNLSTSDMDVYRDRYDDARAIKDYINDKYDYEYTYHEGYKRVNREPRDFRRRRSSKGNVTIEDDSIDLN